MENYKIERINDENVVRLSDEDMRSRGLQVGDEVTVDPASGDENARHERVMRAARKGMSQYRNALAELAR